MKKFVSFLLLLPLLLCAEAIPARTEISFPDGSESAWKHTVPFEFKDGVMTFHTNNGWDSKMWKPLPLKAGTTYRVSGIGKGKIRVQIKDGKKIIASLNLGGNAFREKAIYFLTPETENQKPFTFYFFTTDGQKGESQVKSVVIEEAKPDLFVPDLEKLKASRPEPAVVRGMGVNLMALNDETFQELNSYNVNALRIWMENVPKGRSYKESWEVLVDDIATRLEKIVPLARKYGIKLIPVLSARNIKYDKNIGFLRDPKTHEQMIYFWTQIAVRMKEHHDVIWAYDLFNEPIDRDQLPHAPAEWYPLACRLLKEIRTADPDVWVMYEPGPGGRAGWGEFPKLLPDYKVVYSTHYYSPHSFTHQGIGQLAETDFEKVKEKINKPYPGKFDGLYYDKAELDRSFGSVDRFLARYPVPYCIGEFSAVAWGPGTEVWLKDVIDMMEKRGLSWIFHGYRDARCWNLETEECLESFKEKRKVPNSKRKQVLMEALKKNTELLNKNHH